MADSLIRFWLIHILWNVTTSFIIPVDYFVGLLVWFGFFSITIMLNFSSDRKILACLAHGISVLHRTKFLAILKHCNTFQTVLNIWTSCSLIKYIILVPYIIKLRWGAWAVWDNFTVNCLILRQPALRRRCASWVNQETFADIFVQCDMETSIWSKIFWEEVVRRVGFAASL